MSEKSIVFTVSNDLVSDRRILRICKTLADHGYFVTFIGRLLPGSPPLSEDNFIQKRIRCWFIRGWLFYTELNIRFLFYLIWNRFDIIAAVDYDTMLAGALAKGKTQKMVFDAHEWFEEVPELKNRHFVKKVWSYIAMISIKRSSLRYTVSESLALCLGGLYSLPFEVISNYPVKGDRNHPEGQRENVIVYVGVLNKGRGLEQAILALKEINVDFWIIGEGDLSSSLRQLVVEHGMEEKVVFKGWQHPESIRSILRKARIGLNLLDPGSRSYYYSLANKFFDYVHAGVPSLNMRFPEYIKRNDMHEVSILHDDLDVKSIACSIQNLLNDESLWERLHRNCEIASRSWCWEKESRRLLKLFDSL